jgi:hypothetical protein
MVRKGGAVNVPFIARLRAEEPATLILNHRPSNHLIESAFSTGLCRFTLDCSCGTHFDTPYIDEALEWRELHESLAPLSDQLPA